jgi:uncharacterized membrane protein
MSPPGTEPEPGAEPEPRAADMAAPPVGPFGPHQPAERVVRPRRRLRSGITQGAGLLLGLVLGLVLPRIEGGPRVSGSRTVDVLGVVGIAVLGVTSVIFSLLFLVSQWVAGNYSPRLALFRADPVVWRVFAFVVSLLAFSISATLTIGTHATVSLVVPVATGVAAVVALALVRTVQLRAFSSIQLAQVLSGTAAQGRGVLDSFYPLPDAGGGTATATAGPPVPLPPVRAVLAWPHTTCVVEQVDVRRLVSWARDADAVVVLRIRVGTTVHHGDPVAEIRGGELTHDQLTDDQLTRALIAGQERTFHQDPLYAFRLLADIGLRALSPAVNDPATAVQALDGIEGLLRRLVGTRLDAASVPDEHGAVRVVLALPGWTDFLGTGLDDLCRAALDSAMVLNRAAGLLRALLDAAPPPRRGALRERLEWVEHELHARHPSFTGGGAP